MSVSLLTLWALSLGVSRLLAVPAYDRPTAAPTANTASAAASSASPATPSTAPPAAVRAPCRAQLHGRRAARRLAASSLRTLVRPACRRYAVGGDRSALPGLGVLNQNHLADLWDQPTHVAVKSLRGPYVRALDEYPPKRGSISLHTAGLPAVGQAVSRAARMVDRAELVAKRRSQLLPGQRPDVGGRVLRAQPQCGVVHQQERRELNL